MNQLHGPAVLAAIEALPWIFWIAPIGAVSALIMARVFSASVRARSEGDEEMVRIAAAVREGAMAYLKRQYRVIAVVFVLLVAFLGFAAWMGLQPVLSMLGVPIAGTLSAVTGWIGMRMATSANARTAFAAKSSLNEGLVVAFRSGAVMGLNVVGFALLDASVWFIVLRSPIAESFGLSGDIREFTTVMLSFAMGASTQALFARVGGGIYTKAADVGADLVGKVEAGIPEDDARNPAVVADNVGDNVGDVAGMGADLYESYYGSILASMALGASAAYTLDLAEGEAARTALTLVIAPLALAGFGIIASIFGIFAVRTAEEATFAQLLKSLRLGVNVASGLILAGAFALMFLLAGPNALPIETLPGRWWGIGGAIAAGLLGGVVIARATEYYTSYEHAPTRGIVARAITGPATVIIGGIATGMMSTWIPIATVVVTVVASFVMAGGPENFLMGLYGVSIAAVGMLATLGITLATDAYGPIADNAGGNAEMSGQPAFVRERTDKLDSLGNTTAATGKGFAIGSAALTALALFAAYVQVVQMQHVAQGEAFARGFEYSRGTMVGGASADGPHAIYRGHGTFSLVFPFTDGTKEYDGGLIDRSRLEEHILETLKPGMVLSLSGGRDERLLSVTGEVMHGEGEEAHAHEYEQSIFSARHASIRDVLGFYDATLTNPAVIGGLFTGVLLTFLFCALTMAAVGRAAQSMMEECRRQFAKMREGLRASGMSEASIADPERWPKRVVHAGVEYPDYARCVSISTAGAQREMVVPSLLAILVPIAVGLLLDVPGVMGMLAGGAASGFAVAVFMANAGGAWDNAKKLIESFGKVTADEFLADAAVRDRFPSELREGLLAKAQDLQSRGAGGALVYGKGSDDHKAAVVGDTVGDPFKDTSGPSLNILIKLISIVSVVFAGLIVKYGPVVGEWIGLK